MSFIEANKDQNENSKLEIVDGKEKNLKKGEKCERFSAAGKIRIDKEVLLITRK